MKVSNKIIVFWGVCDLLSISWFVAWNTFHQRIPFYSDFLKTSQISKSFGDPFFVFTIYIISVISYISLIFSGILLIKNRSLGAIISYVQIPFRLLAFIPPSIFFIMWPLKYIFDDPSAISALITYLSLLLFSEILKLSSIIMWHRRTRLAVNAGDK